MYLQKFSTAADCKIIFHVFEMAEIKFLFYRSD